MLPMASLKEIRRWILPLLILSKYPKLISFLIRRMKILCHTQWRLRHGKRECLWLSWTNGAAISCIDINFLICSKWYQQLLKVNASCRCSLQQVNYLHQCLLCIAKFSDNHHRPHLTSAVSAVSWPLCDPKEQDNWCLIAGCITHLIH